MFGHVLRFFQCQSLRKEILLRGAFSHGEVFRIEEGTNTVMGPVVSDAAAWHQRAEWVGVHATPSTSIFVQEIEEVRRESMGYLFVDHRIPFKKGQEPLELKAVNWPKGMYLSAERDYRRARAQLLCVFRMMWIADSGRSGSAIPDEVDHRFRPKWIAFGRCGSPISGIVNARR